MDFQIKPYDTWMFDEFYSLNKATSGEMNVQSKELGNRVSEFAAYLADPYSVFLTAWVDGHMRGYILLKRDEKGKKQSSSHVALMRIAVHPDYQGNGLGTDLVKVAIQQAESQGKIKRIEILNYASSIDDRHWFEKLGFEIEGRLKNRILSNGTYIDAFIMGMTL